jgi:hypothetical protein
LFLLPAGPSALIETQTENVSMNGFFCYSDRLFPPGERLRFLLRLSPGGGETNAGKSVYLDGLAEVVHVKIGSMSHRFGLGCRVDGYRVLPQTDFGTCDDIRTILSEPFRADPTNANSPNEPQPSLEDAAFG